MNRTDSRYLNQEDVRDIRNFDQILSTHSPEEFQSLMAAPIGRDMRNDLFLFFRRLKVRLDRAGDKTKPFQRVKPGGRVRKKVLDTAPPSG